MFNSIRFWTLVVSMMGMALFAGCKKKEELSQLGQRCGGKVRCAQGLKCWAGLCEDLSGNSESCKFVRDASGAIMNAAPKDLLRGIEFEYDPNFITEIAAQAATLYRGFAQGMPERSCKRIQQCEMPKLGIGYGWFWTRAAYEATKTVPEGAKKISGDAISVNVDSFEQSVMGEDTTMFPEVKIRQMSQHRIGCKAKVTVRVREDYAGFVTFHFWRNTGCEFVEPKDGGPSFKCEGEEVLKDPKYTYTVYLSPYTSAQLEAQKKGKDAKGATARAFFTGNPGTYDVEIWAYNPIDENLFGEHRQFADETAFSKFGSFKFCPKYKESPNENGCGCIGFVQNKITVSLNPDPFFLAFDEEKCMKMTEEPKGN